MSDPTPTPPAPTPTPTPAPSPTPPTPGPDIAAVTAAILQDLMWALKASPVWQTAGFWVTIATMVLGVLVLTGVVKPDTAASANVQAIVQDAGGLAALVIPSGVLAIAEVLRHHHLIQQRAAAHQVVLAFVLQRRVKAAAVPLSRD